MVSVVEKNLPGFLLTGTVFFFISVVPAVGSNSITWLEQTLCEMTGFIFIAERCTRRQVALTVDTSKKMQA